MVQNEYLEILLELGVVGLALFVLIIAGLFKITAKHKYLWAIIVAFGVQWWLFSGYPNALHIFVIFAFFYAYSLQKKKSE